MMPFLALVLVLIVLPVLVGLEIRVAVGRVEQQDQGIYGVLDPAA